MILHRAWWILLIYFRSITTLLALQNPMRYQLQRVVTSTIVRFKSVLSSSSSFQRSQKTTPFDATYHKDSSIHKRVLYYFRSSATNESYKRHWISSTTTSLRMSTEENGMIRLTPTTTGSTTRPQPLPQSTNNEADDVTDSAMTQQWEKLYQGSSSNSIHKIDYLSSERIIAIPAYDDVRVVSFDLDNTLWNTSATIDAANEVLAQYLREQLLRSFPMNATRDGLRVEKVMGILFTANKAKYSPIEADGAKSPVLLTQLRKDAIQQVVSEHIEQAVSNTTLDNAAIVESLVNSAFDVWMKARHDAISQQLTPSTTYVMEYIQSLTRTPPLGTTNHPTKNTKVLIGAITDGNSNPKLIPALSKVFDFYINAEMVGIGKPNKRIYIQAVKDVFQNYPTLFHDLIAQATITNDEISDDQIEELIGPWWIHIGDDFMKDIVASNSLNMRNIWTRELLSTKKAAFSKSIQRQQQQESVQRTVDDLMQVVNERKVVEMSIGADTYLADAVSSEFATAVVDELRDVVSVFQKWQNDSLVSSTTSSETTKNKNVRASTLQVNPPPPTNRSKVSINSDNKFCIECGTKQLIVAKFCSACGAAQ